MGYYKKQRPAVSKLPVVIPMILYHGEKPWNISNSTKPLFAIIKGTEEYVPDYTSVIIDLSFLDDKKIKGGVKLRTFLLALKYSRNLQLLKKTALIIKQYNNIGERGQRYLSVILIYIGSVIPKQNQGKFLGIIKREHPDGEKVMKTVADSLREEGVKIGIKIGMEKGIEKGMGKGIEKGKIEGRAERDSEKELLIAGRMLSKGMNVKLIHEITGLSVKKINELVKKI